MHVCIRVYIRMHMYHICMYVSIVNFQFVEFICKSGCGTDLCKHTCKVLYIQVINVLCTTDRIKRSTCPYYTLSVICSVCAYIHIIIYIYVCRLTEKTDELKKSKEELESIQAELKSQIEKLKNDNERCVCMYI